MLEEVCCRGIKVKERKVVMIKTKFSSLTHEAKLMREKAQNIRSHCRFLKSTTYVGCCILTEAPNYYPGCNFDFEWGKTIHAEESAINNMIVNSLFDNELITDMYIYCEREQFTPCGDCRDKIMRFGVCLEDISIYIDNGEDINSPNYKYVVV